MNHIKWVAWGVIDVENLPTDKTSGANGQARRSYLKKLRADFESVDMKLHCGGSTQVPWYKLERQSASELEQKCSQQVHAGPDALKKLCAWALEQLGEVDVSGADGGVRCAGDEAQDGPVGTVHERSEGA